MFLFLFEAVIVSRWRSMRVFLKSFGCSTNLADGEVLAGCLAKAGYVLTRCVSDADVVVYNTCAVKGPTENRMIEILKRTPPNKKVVVAGCLPMINFERLRKEVSFDAAVGPAAGERIVEIVEKVAEGKKITVLDELLHAKPSLELPHLRINPVVSMIPVNYGCLGACAYCCVVFARGHLRSYTIQEIVERVKRDLAVGVCEFWLTSQDVACYGRDLSANLVELLNAVCAVEGKFKVRVGMMTPNLVLDILDDLIQAFKNEKIFKFLHLPVQSGDDKVLENMHRFYSVEDFKHIITTFSKEFPELTVATDIICGFPGEDEEAFKKSLHLLEEVKPDIVNVSKFFARPRTLAAKMQKDFVSRVEIKRRTNVVARLAKKIAYEKNQRWIGWTGEVFINEVGKVSNSWVGRNYAYKPIVVRTASNPYGKFVQAKVVKAYSTHLEADLLQ